ncbi:hypothetical protein [Undibacterium sp. TS12]|uniref:hypothetical protein n=1 Tax=Undibacterium sp. TS12 TaxID=2908202 RepID=UPI001F4D3571|nr:hypothetical protein [Undibacterium sp. TS12]MCH8621280.1 hypothetical protein [Undibacterium sp. TS12]
MSADKRVSLVLLAYFAAAGLCIAMPVLLLLNTTVPHRFEFLAVSYALIFLFFVIRNFLLGGKLNVRLSTQINQIYGTELRGMGSRFIDLHCLSLLRVYGVWLAFPAAWLDKIVGPNDLFHIYEVALDTHLGPQARPHQDEHVAH